MNHNHDEGAVTAADETKGQASRLVREVGTSGTLIYGGQISQQDYNRKLDGKEGLDVWDEMRRSEPSTRVLFQAIKHPIVGAEWTVKPASDEQKDVDIADRVKHNLFNVLNFRKVLDEMMNYLAFGFAVHEKVYEYTEIDGKPFIALVRMPSRKQSSIYRWEMEDGGEGVHQTTETGDDADIPRAKLLIVTNEQEGDNYEGMSIFRAAYKPWYLKTQIEKIMALSVEKQGLGIPLLKPPKGADDRAKRAARKAAQNLRANEKAYIEIPDGWGLEMLDMKAGTRTDPMPFIQYLDQQILKSGFVQFMNMGSHSGSGGTQSSSGDQSRLLNRSLESIARTVQAAWQEDVIKQIVDLNYSNVKNYPTLEFSKISDEDLGGLSSLIGALFNAKALTPDRDMENTFRANLHLNPMPDEYYDDYENRPGSQEKVIDPATGLPAAVDPKTGKPVEDPEADPKSDKLPPKKEDTEKKASDLLEAARGMNSIIRAEASKL